jgi:tetratricopeptide (TPR) repeat protein
VNQLLVGMKRLGLLDLLHLKLTLFIYKLCILGAPLEQQVRLYNSVVSKLMASEEFSSSGVLAHALSRRARYYLELGENHHAIEDALQTLTFGSSTVCAKTRSRAYRVLADAHEGLGNLQEAIQALQEWYKMDPIVRTKLQKEIQRLNE